MDLDKEDEVSNPDEEDGKTLWQFILLVITGGKKVISGVREVTSGAVSSVPEAVGGITGAFSPGGSAVGIFENTDPDAPVSPDLYALDESPEESEALDPWRYR